MPPSQKTFALTFENSVLGTALADPSFTGVLVDFAEDGGTSLMLVIEGKGIGLRLCSFEDASTLTLAALALAHQRAQQDGKIAAAAAAELGRVVHAAGHA